VVCASIRDGLICVSDASSSHATHESRELCGHRFPLDCLAMSLHRDKRFCAAAWVDRLAVFAAPWNDPEWRLLASHKCNSRVGTCPLLSVYLSVILPRELI
jgi:hypothetical protein